MNEIETTLWQLTVDDLKNHCQKLGIKGGKIKEETIKNIMAFYQTEGWLEEYFKTLEGFDKEYTYLIVQEDFVPINAEVKALKAKYNIKTNYFSYHDDDNLKFSIVGFIPKIFRDKLLKLVPPIAIEFEDMSDIVKLDDCYGIISDDNPIEKIDHFILYASSNKIKVTEKTNWVTKANILKFYELYSIKDVSRNLNDGTLKNQSDTIIANGIITILLASDILKIKNGILDLGKNYQNYVKLNKIEKGKYLLDAYIHSKTTYINETKRLMNYKYKLSEKIDLSNPRLTILEYIKKFPIDKWVSADKLKYFLRIKNIYYLRTYTKEVLQKQEYGNWYDNACYNDFENSFLDSVLMDYLAVLGILDVVIECNETDYGNEYIEVSYVKLTEFGAMVLGLKKAPVVKKEKKPFIINDHFEIIIEESPKRMEYELYFERFLTKKVTHENTIYKLDFTGLAKSYDLGINPKEVLKYLEQESTGIPPIVLSQLNRWMSSLNKITIKTVTVVEAPPEILRFLCNDKNFSALKDESRNEQFIIKKGKTSAMKKVIENNECFCKIID